MASAEQAPLPACGGRPPGGDQPTRGGPGSAEPHALRIEVALSVGPGCVALHALCLPAGATVADALRASAALVRLEATALDAMTPGIWGRVCAPQTLLRDGDRVELYRALTVDPKEARRLRYRRDGLRRPPRV